MTPRELSQERDYMDLPQDDYDPSYYDIEDDEPDEFEMALMECGMGMDGFCQLVGTEFCDWDCPVMDMKLKSKRGQVAESGSGK